MKIETFIDSLTSYAINNGLAEPVDDQVLTNRLLDLLRKDDYEPSKEPLTEDLEAGRRYDQQGRNSGGDFGLCSCKGYL